MDLAVSLLWPRVCEELWNAYSDRLLLPARAIAPEAADEALFSKLLRGPIDVRNAGPYLFRAVRNAIGELGDDSPKVRDQATEKLRSMGAKARRMVRAALKDAQDPEVRSRLEGLLK